MRTVLPCDRPPKWGLSGPGTWWNGVTDVSVPPMESTALSCPLTYKKIFPKAETMLFDVWNIFWLSPVFWEGPRIEHHWDPPAGLLQETKPLGTGCVGKPPTRQGRQTQGGTNAVGAAQQWVLSKEGREQWHCSGTGCSWKDANYPTGQTQWHGSRAVKHWGTNLNLEMREPAGTGGVWLWHTCPGGDR